LAKPNYQFEKRQRDLAKKRKQEEKRRRKITAPPPAGNESSQGPVGMPEPDKPLEN